jgi:uncharacterized protein (DUF983 family)
MPLPAPTFGRMFGRALLLRCPYCGEGRAFRTWFRMHNRCPSCRFVFEREPGYFLGATYFNYGVTAISCFLVTPIFCFGFDWRVESMIPIWCALGTVVGLWFFRYARLIWVAFDLSHDPATPHDFSDEDRTIPPIGR